MTPDITLIGQGFYEISSNTEAGSDWLEANVDFEGVPYTDSAQYAHDIAQGATDDGLVVGVNGFVYLAGGLRGQAVAA